MNHDTIRFMASLAVYLLLLTVPILVVAFTDRFKQQLAPQEYGVLFAIAAAIGLLLFLPAISIVSATALLALGLAWLSGRYALAAITYERELTPIRLFPGDQASLTLRLNNRKLFPLASVHITDPIQYGLIRPSNDFEDLLRFSGGVHLLDNLGYALMNRTAVGPFQSVVRTYHIDAFRRGVYTLGPAHVESSDPFGIFRKEATMGGKLDIVVFPNVYRPEEIGLPFREALGEVATRRALVDDPTLIAGSREYRPGDPLNRVHWKATARTGDLQVRLHDPSTTVQIMMVLNLNTFPRIWQGVDLDRMEAVIDLAASLAVWALDRDFAVGLRSNGIVPGTERMPRVAPSANPHQATVLLEHLARLAFSGRYSPETVLEDESRRLQSGSSIVFVTPILTPELIAVLTTRKLSGRVSVVYCGRFASPVIRGVPIFLAVPPFGAARAVS